MRKECAFVFHFLLYKCPHTNICMNVKRKKKKKTLKQLFQKLRNGLMPKKRNKKFAQLAYGKLKQHRVRWNRIRITVFTTIKINVDCAMDGGFCSKTLCIEKFLWQKYQIIFSFSFSFSFSLSFSQYSSFYSNDLALIPLSVVVVDLHEMEKEKKNYNNNRKRCLRNTKKTFSYAKMRPADKNKTYFSVDF